MEARGVPVRLSEKATWRQFTPEFKSQAVERVLSGHKVAVVAKALGIGESLLPTWVTRHRLSEGSGALQVEQAAEIARLKRMLSQKEEERRKSSLAMRLQLGYVHFGLLRAAQGPWQIRQGCGLCGDAQTAPHRLWCPKIRSGL